MFCQCGCGGLTNIVKTNYTNNGRIKGEYSRYILGHALKLYRGSGGRKSNDENVMKVSKEFGSIRLSVMIADFKMMQRRKGKT